MTSGGISLKTRGDPWRQLAKLWSGDIVSAQGLSAMVDTSFVMKPVIRAGGTIPDGSGDESSVTHIGEYCLHQYASISYAWIKFSPRALRYQPPSPRRYPK